MTVSGIRGTAGIDLTERKSQAAGLSEPAPKSTEDRVSLSAAARAPIPERLRGLSEQAHQDPQLAKELAYTYGHTAMNPIVDCSSNPFRYAATGEVVTPEKDALYAKQSNALKGASSALYASEKAKGTADADILDQLLTLAASQPPDFRALIGWDK